MRALEWIKRHKLLLAILAAIGYWTLVNTSPLFVRTASISNDFDPNLYESQSGIAANMGNTGFNPRSTRLAQDTTPTPGKDRLKAVTTSLSLVVKDVSEVVKSVEGEVNSLGGYLVDSYVSNPQEASSGSITIRIPSERRAQILDMIKRLGVRTVSETIIGTDLTDEYTDLDRRLELLNRTMTKFERILEESNSVRETLEVQREITNLQTQIDSLEGQKRYLQGSANLSKITVYLSTDELALPYTPNQPWRPSVIFKQAVRSLVANLRGAGSFLIWAGVYSPIWLPIVLIYLWRKRKKRQPELV